MINIFPGKSVALQRAEAVAGILSKSKLALRIYLFGSISYLGDGRDIDLMVNVPDEEAGKFFSTMADEFDDPEYYTSKIIRLRVALAILKLDKCRERLFEITQSPPRDTELDIFLFPQDWRENPMVHVLNKRFPEFLGVISRQIRPYHEGSGSFQGLGFWRTYLGKYLPRSSESTWGRYKRFFAKTPA